MGRIAIELVPRDSSYLLEEINIVKKYFPAIDTINIPDLLRYNMRSWEGCQAAKPYYAYAIPHVRAIDINLEKPLPMAAFLQENSIDEVLVVAGDPPQDMSRKIYPSTTCEVISKFKKEIPHIKVYAGIDQYRHSIRQEYNYIKRKINAGADGFFTQPFFDLRLLEIYAEMLQEVEVFWGISPVTSEKSHNYWETKNNAVFPSSFLPSLEWNVEFARQVLGFVKKIGASVYFMPIRMDIKTYLAAVFNL